MKRDKTNYFIVGQFNLDDLKKKSHKSVKVHMKSEEKLESYDFVKVVITNHRYGLFKLAELLMSL